MNTPLDRYEVIETLGTGATSRVEKARDALIGRTVALKTFLQGSGSPDLEQQFLREAQIIGGLTHPNIVALYDVGINKDGAPYLVMEYVDGKTLETVFDAGPLALARVGVWGGDLATALGQAHRAKIIHGDVKPANILVTSEQRVKLGDFGIARLTTHASSSGILVGTPAYLSPEQILGNLQDSRSDIFSLGIVLYQMATGIRPFDGDSIGAVGAQIISSTPPPPSHHNPSLPPAFDQLVMRCLSKDPADRYPTAEALAACIYPFARKSNAATLRSSSAATQRRNIPWWSTPFQHKDMWKVAAAVILLIFVVSIVGGIRKHSIPTLTASAATVDLSGVASTRNTSPEIVSTAMVRISSSAVVDLPSTESPLPSTKPELPSTKPESPRSHASKPSTLKATRQEASSLPPKRVAEASVRELPVSTPSVTDQPASPKPLASLRVEIVSAIGDEILAVYAGQDVLISTRLDAAHLGEALHFDCPLSPGAHPLRVVLYRADDSLHIQKEGFGEIVSGSSNTLDIHVNRRSKLLIRKEAALEISWPNPHAATAESTSPPAPSSSSAK